MQKSKLDKFISKYNLGGNVNSVKWKSTTDSLSTTFVTPDKSLLGNVKADKVSFETSELGIYQTEQLQKLLGVLGEDVELAYVFGVSKGLAERFGKDRVRNTPLCESGIISCAAGLSINKFTIWRSSR